MTITTTGCNLGIALIAWLMTAAVSPADDAWPLPPEKNAAITIPAQPWPRQPGERSIKVYVHYPGGELGRVTARTGLMLSLHNWGGTQAVGTADPQQLADRLDVVAISVDYLQSGPWDPNGPAYDFGYLQALDALRALYAIYDGLERAHKPFDGGRVFATGGSGGGNVTLMANKLAPRTFACIIDMCGMTRLSDDIAFGIHGQTHLNAGYRRDPASPDYLRRDEQEIRFVGNPAHLKIMRELGNRTKVLIVHGVNDDACPVADARELADNLRQAGLDVEPHFVTQSDLDGDALKSTGHPLGNRTRIVFRFAERYLSPSSPEALRRSSPPDFLCRDEVRYPTSGGSFVISYKTGYPVGRFEATKGPGRLTRVPARRRPSSRTTGVDGRGPGSGPLSGSRPLPATANPCSPP